MAIRAKLAVILHADVVGSTALVQQDERIGSIQARLGPGEVRGESVLRLKVTEERPYDFNYETGNLEPPSVGSWRQKFTFIHRNLTGVAVIIF